MSTASERSADKYILYLPIFFHDYSTQVATTKLHIGLNFHSYFGLDSTKAQLQHLISFL